MSELAHDLRRLAHDVTVATDAPWQQMRALGLDRVGIEERLGGSGGDVADLATVVKAFACEGAVTPLVEASVAAHIMDARDLGDGWGTIARGDHLAVGTSTVSGTLTDVDDSGASVLVALMATGPALVIDLTGPSVSRGTRTTSVSDETLADVTLDDTPFRPAGDSRLGHQLWDLLELSALLGHSSGAHQLTRSWVKQREQFGRPLISIPAVAARLAEMTVQLELAEAAVQRVHDTDDERRDHLLASARLVVAEAATVVARTSHQLHGAMGITGEYPLHRHTTAIWSRRDRARSRDESRSLLGSTAMCGGEAALWDDLTA